MEPPTDRRLSYFLCLFPMAVFSLLPLSAVAYDFLLLLCLISTVVLFLCSWLMVKPLTIGAFSLWSFGVAFLRMGLIGATLRKIIGLGVAFDGQLIRSLAESFHPYSIIAHIMLLLLAYLLFRKVIALLTNGLLLFRELHSEPLSNLSIQAGNEAEKGSFLSPNLVIHLMTRTAWIEMNTIPILVGAVFFGTVQNRDILDENSYNKSLFAASILQLSAYLIFWPLSSVTLFSLREWLRHWLKYPLAKIPIRQELFAYRYWIMALGVSLAAVSLAHGIPKSVFVVIGSSLFAAGFISTILENRGPHSVEAAIRQDVEAEIFQKSQRVKLLFGRNLWNDYFVTHEARLQQAVNITRLEIMRDAGTFVEEIPVLFGPKVIPDGMVILINNKRISSIAIELPACLRERPEFSGDRQVDQQSAIDDENQLEKVVQRITKTICLNVSNVLRNQAPDLSVDPAIEHLIKVTES